METKHKDHLLGDTLARYLIDQQSGQTALLLLPADRLGEVAQRRALMELPEFERMGVTRDAWGVGSLVQLHLASDPPPASQGQSLRESASGKRLAFASQEVRDLGGRTVVHTVLDGGDYRCHHQLIHYHGYEGLEVRTEFENTGEQTQTLEMLSSFSLDNLSPFSEDDAAGVMHLHRMRGRWSLEGCQTVDSVESLNLERSWLGYFPESERFGQLGSFPVSRFFPYAAVEDRAAGVFWGAQLLWPGSWQIELSREQDCLALSGGLADAEFGHWRKEVAAGERFAAPPAYLAVSSNGLEGLNHRLTEMQHRAADQQPQVEAELPVIFNEWCTSWGKPTQQNVLELADLLEGKGVTYLVLDAGWSKQPEAEMEPQEGNGEWEVCERAFPDGMKFLTREIRKRGMIPGIWFEFEVTTKGAKFFSEEFDAWHLQRHGQVIKTDGWRSYWDLRQPRVVDLLSEKVVDFLRENDFGYFKVDYNGPIGYGVDGAESLGEGLRQQIVAVQAFFQKIREELPELVIENCASGGHRLEPSMIGATALSAITDAHECPEIPRIAASMQSVLLPRQALVMTAIHGSDNAQRLYYSMAANFLGRFCLTGQVQGLSQEQWGIVDEAISFYREVSNIIKRGRSAFFGTQQHAIRNCSGTQVVLRMAEDGQSALLVCHSFQQPLGEDLEVPLDGAWQMVRQFNQGVQVSVEAGLCRIAPMKEYEGTVVLLRQSP